jgi:hypothetical protein
VPTSRIVLEGLKETVEKLRAFPAELKRGMTAAGDEAGNEILNTEGLRNYPPSTPANQPPTPYYIRGRGTQYANSNSGSSERYGTQWNVTTRGYTTTIGNRASYAPYVGGDKQPQHMADKGWRKLFAVADQKRAEIQRIYSAWLERAKRRVGL